MNPDNLEIARAVVAILNDRKTEAYLEYPGWVHVPLSGDVSLAFGYVNETWDGDFSTIDGVNVGAFNTDLSTSEPQEPMILAGVVLDSIQTYERTKE